jgi:hypothetical protein
MPVTIFREWCKYKTKGIDVVGLEEKQVGVKIWCDIYWKHSIN